MTTLTAADLRDISARLEQANHAHMRRYPGETGRRQPVHTVYGGAQLFKSDSAVKLGALARRAFEEYAPNAATLAQALGWENPVLAQRIYARVKEKLQREPVEDFRIDFEDGYGNRPDAEEDGHATGCAREVAAGLAAGTLPPFIGIRIKPFTEELRHRSIRTLDLCLTELVTQTGGKLPPNFYITLPKIPVAEHVSALADIFDLLEPKLGLPGGALKMELMIEITQSLFTPRGENHLPLLLAAARGRCAAAHFGTYDYTASCSITAAYQHMMHPACDHAKHLMQVAFAGSGVWLSDGATNIMPVGPHRAAEGKPLTPEQARENREVVHRAWKLHYDHVRYSLAGGFYQGWDLHPGQLPTRYAAVYAFFLEGLDAASERLRNFVSKAAQATLVGDVFDDAATGQGLLNYFLRAINCGAISEEEALPLTGLTLAELRSASFVKILKGRAK
jgi:hypothetical protein